MPAPTIAALHMAAEAARDRLELELAELLEELARTAERVGLDSTRIALRCARPLRRG